MVETYYCFEAIYSINNPYFHLWILIDQHFYRLIYPYWDRLSIHIIQELKVDIKTFLFIYLSRSNSQNSKRKNNNNNSHSKIDFQLLPNGFPSFKDRSTALIELVWYRWTVVDRVPLGLRILSLSTNLKSELWLLRYHILKTDIKFETCIYKLPQKPNK